MSLKTMLDSRNSGPNGALLKGSDLESGTQTVTVVVSGIRQSPETFTAPAIMDFKKPVVGKTGMALNKTNLKKLIELYGPDEKALVGKKIKLVVVMDDNPQTHESVPTLRVSK
jgi:hypothetical protein